MKHTIHHVVGDRFAAFARNPNVVTISELSATLSAGDARYGDDVRFLAGQGLQRELVEALLATADRMGRRRLFSLWRKPPPADGRLSHKSEAHNTLVTRPERIGEDLFRSYLCCDERCELLADHITGQHIPGMLLVEAARQLFMAAYEEHLGAREQGKVGFALTVLNSSYFSYLFPTEIELRMQVLEESARTAEQVSFHTLTEGIQGGDSLFQQETRAIVVPHEVLAAVEAKRARLHLATMQAEHEGAVELE